MADGSAPARRRVLPKPSPPKRLVPREAAPKAWPRPSAGVQSQPDISTTVLVSPRPLSPLLLQPSKPLFEAEHLPALVGQTIALRGLSSSPRNENSRARQATKPDGLSHLSLFRGGFGPRRRNPVHACISHQLPHVLVGVDNDTEVHAIQIGRAHV